MTERMHPDASARRGVGQRPPRLASVAAGAIVAAACIGYGVWSAREEVAGPATAAPKGTISRVDHAPNLAPTPDDTIPTARLTLDEGNDTSVLPVVNAHLEVSEGREGSAKVIDVSPAVRQLGYTDGPVGSPSKPPAWLTGEIEPLPAPDPGSRPSRRAGRP